MKTSIFEFGSKKEAHRVAALIRQAIPTMTIKAKNKAVIVTYEGRLHDYHFPDLPACTLLERDEIVAGTEPYAEWTSIPFDEEALALWKSLGGDIQFDEDGIGWLLLSDEKTEPYFATEWHPLPDSFSHGHTTVEWSGIILKDHVFRTTGVNQITYMGKLTPDWNGTYLLFKADMANTHEVPA